MAEWRCQATEASTDPGGHNLHECRLAVGHSRWVHKCRMCDHGWRNPESDDLGTADA